MVTWGDPLFPPYPKVLEGEDLERFRRMMAEARRAFESFKVRKNPADGP